MNLERMPTQVVDNAMKLSAFEESLKSAHKRIDDNDRITSGIHKLAANMEVLTVQLKSLTESVNSSTKRLEESLKKQGERIGVLEQKPDPLEKKSAHNWNAVVKQLISLLVAAAVTLFLAKII